MHVAAALSARRGQPALLAPHLRLKFLRLRGLHAIILHTLRGISCTLVHLVAVQLRGRKLHFHPTPAPGSGHRHSVGFRKRHCNQHSRRCQLRNNLQSNFSCRNSSDVKRDSSCWILFRRMEWRLHRRRQLHSPDERRSIRNCQLQHGRSSSSDRNPVGFWRRHCDQHSHRYQLRHNLQSDVPRRHSSHVDCDPSYWVLFRGMEWRVHRDR